MEASLETNNRYGFHQEVLTVLFFFSHVQDENGVNRPVCSYIRPLRAGRLLDTPRQAARFVSVLGYERAPVIGGGGGKQEQWCTLLAFICRNKVCENSLCTTPF